ncbi:hypothetical protein KJ742_03535 [Patescibacteria group bacterium]|nr:hypothetical protein [Patescibacteria group bacterium]MBU1682993.1 hypothetical protein [Patescibacteria group bacterium]MBU1934766.1 hypothetical protein [Patescibacteria group bacterium]
MKNIIDFLFNTRFAFFAEGGAPAPQETPEGEKQAAEEGATVEDASAHYRGAVQEAEGVTETATELLIENLKSEMKGFHEAVQTDMANLNRNRNLEGNTEWEAMSGKVSDTQQKLFREGDLEGLQNYHSGVIAELAGISSAARDGDKALMRARLHELSKYAADPSYNTARITSENIPSEVFAELASEAGKKAWEEEDWDKEIREFQMACDLDIKSVDKVLAGIGEEGWEQAIKNAVSKKQFEFKEGRDTDGLLAYNADFSSNLRKASGIATRIDRAGTPADKDVEELKALTAEMLS